MKVQLTPTCYLKHEPSLVKNKNLFEETDSEYSFKQVIV